MKQETHPKYFTEAKIACSCGKMHVVGATKEKMAVEICSNCHPFFTGQEKLIDTAGRVEKFKARQKKAAEVKAARKPSKAPKVKAESKPKAKAKAKTKK
ncbi:MAG: 50S ribosomal protein L31 [Candidatus Colwellbacteria bacterium]